MSFEDVLAANEAYSRAFALGGLEGRAGRGLAILTCMDSRIEPLAMLGLRPGDAKILRNAGARVTDEVIPALVVAHTLLGVERFMVVPHTKCRMASTETELREAIRAARGSDISEMRLATAPDQVAALRADVERVRAEDHLAALEVGGFVFDVDTGRLERIC